MIHQNSNYTTVVSLNSSGVSKVSNKKRGNKGGKKKESGAPENAPIFLRSECDVIVELASFRTSRCFPLRYWLTSRLLHLF